MISFERDGTRFNYRVVGVCLHDGHVLLHRAEQDDFWSLMGGRVEMLETSARALEREIREELGCTARVGTLLWIVESFFGTRERRFHELGLHYLVDLEDRPDLYDKTRAFHGVEDNDRRDSSLHLIFQWFPVAELGSVRLYPSFLCDALRDPPETTQHVVDGEL